MSNGTTMISIMNALDHIDKIMGKRCLWVIRETPEYSDFVTWHVVKYEHRGKFSFVNSLYESKYASDVEIFLEGYCLAVKHLKANRT